MPSAAPKQPHDAYGFAATGREAFISSSFGHAYDQSRIALKHEALTLNQNPAPKTQQAEEDAACMEAAGAALSLVQGAINKIPQPSWVNDPEQFKTQVDIYFHKAAEQNGVSPSRMDAAVDNYNMRPASKHDVSAKLAQVNQQIQMMDSLVNNINNSFNETFRLAKSPAEFKALTQMGVTSIDGIYAVDPGFFKPKDLNGNPVDYDPKNLLHSLQAIERFLDNPATATVELGIRLFGPKAIEQLREVMREDYGAQTLEQQAQARARKLDVPDTPLAPDPNGRFAPPPKNGIETGDDDPNNPQQKQRMGLAPRPFGPGGGMFGG